MGRGRIRNARPHACGLPSSSAGAVPCSTLTMLGETRACDGRPMLAFVQYVGWRWRGGPSLPSKFLCRNALHTSPSPRTRMSTHSLESDGVLGQDHQAQSPLEHPRPPHRLQLFTLAGHHLRSGSRICAFIRADGHTPQSTSTFANDLEVEHPTPATVRAMQSLPPRAPSRITGRRDHRHPPTMTLRAALYSPSAWLSAGRAPQVRARGIGRTLRTIARPSESRLRRRRPFPGDPPARATQNAGLSILSRTGWANTDTLPQGQSSTGLCATTYTPAHTTLRPCDPPPPQR